MYSVLKAFPKRHPVVAGLVSVVAIAGPQWASAVWSLFSSDPLFVVIKQHTGAYATSIIRWLPVAIGTALLLLIVALQINTRYVVRKRAKTEQTPVGAPGVTEHDPRVYLEPVNSEFIPTGNIPFEFVNRGGSVAHNICVEGIALDGRQVSFARLAHLDVGASYRFLPEIEGGIMQHHDITAPLMKEWDRAGKAIDEYPLQLGITYEDFCGKRKFKSRVIFILPSGARDSYAANRFQFASERSRDSSGREDGI